ncbi:MAG: hypothetical protein ACXU86_14965 [Archangium sp.]
MLVPMATELETSAEVLARGSWSFRCSRGDFEYLQPTARMLAPRFRPNFEQLCRFHPEFKAIAEEHDAALDRLRQACQAAYARLMESEPFQRLASELEEPSNRKYLAEYVINGVKELGWDYPLREFWVKRGMEFLALRQAPGLEESFKALEDAGGRYRQQHRALHEAVDRLQEELADRFGLPPVDPVGEVVL